MTFDLSCSLHFDLPILHTHLLYTHQLSQLCIRLQYQNNICCCYHHTQLMSLEIIWIRFALPLDWASLKNDFVNSSYVCQYIIHYMNICFIIPPAPPSLEHGDIVILQGGDLTSQYSVKWSGHALGHTNRKHNVFWAHISHILQMVLRHREDERIYTLLVSILNNLFKDHISILYNIKISR